MNPELSDELVVRCEFDFGLLACEHDPMRAVAEGVRAAAEELAEKDGHKLRASEPLRIKGYHAIEAVTGRDVFLVESVWPTDRK